MSEKSRVPSEKRYRVVVTLDSGDIVAYLGPSLSAASHQASSIREHGFIFQRGLDAWQHYPVHRVMLVTLESL